VEGFAPAAKEASLTALASHPTIGDTMGSGSSKVAGSSWLTLAVFVVAFIVRLAFWQATPDRDWPHSMLYKGDALVWTDYATALSRGQDYELGLPLRPPGNGYLLSWLGVSSRAEASAGKLFWCLLGALAVALFYRGAHLAFGPRVALWTAAWCTFSTALLILSTSLNNETPYLVLVGLLVLIAPRLVQPPAARSPNPRLAVLLLWGLVNALACLVRVEHVLLFALSLVWLAFTNWRRLSLGRSLRSLAVVTGVFLTLLLPWHLEAWSSIRRFNTEPRSLSAGAEAAQSAIERALAGVAWTAEARAERAELPAFARRSAANFVAATVVWRGGTQVTGADFAILEQAFGSRPKALASHPFVALYGPLNFYLAQRTGAPVGFDPRGLDRLPPLVGGAASYPQPLLAGLPPRDLNFLYPPHVEMVTDGYLLGRQALLENPARAGKRSLARLDALWQGASLGWTGYGLPWGVSGLRRAVDLAVPQGTGFAVWRALLLLACAAGLWLGRKVEVIWLWIALVAHKLFAATLFFGYARHGATLVPVVALLSGLLIVRLARPRLAAVAGKAAVVLVTLAAVGLGVEFWRWFDPPAVALDGRSITGPDPFPAGQHLDRRVSVPE